MTPRDQIIRELDLASDLTGWSQNYICKQIGKSGDYYTRMKKGARIWPETYEDMSDRLQKLLDERSRAA